MPKNSSRHAPQHTDAEDRSHHPTTEVFREDAGHRQGQQEERRRERQQAFRQAHPRAFGQAGRWVATTQEHEDRADEHHRRHQQQCITEDAVMQAETVNQNRQHNGRHRTASRGDVGVGDVFVPRDHMVQIDHVTLGHGEQAADQVDFRSPAPAPHSHPPQRAQDSEAQGSEQQDWKKGVQHGGAPTRPQVLRPNYLDALLDLLWERACSRQRCGQSTCNVERHGLHSRASSLLQGYPQALRNPCTTATRHRSPRGCCAAPRSRRCGTASSRRPPGSAKVAA